MNERLIRCAKLVKKKSPLLLTIGTILGVGTVIFTTAKASIKTKEEIDELKYDAMAHGDGTVEKKEIAKVVAKNCWPVALASGTTIAMTIGNHKINASRLHTATVAYDFYKEAYETYREKVREKIGEPSRRELEADIAKDKVDRSLDTSLIRQVGDGNVLFVESITGQAFRSSVDYIRQCEKSFNNYMHGEDWVSINEWLCELGLRPMDNDIGNYLGFAEQFDIDSINVVLTPSNEVFSTGETATFISYQEPLCVKDDHRVPSW